MRSRFWVLMGALAFGAVGCSGRPLPLPDPSAPITTSTDLALPGPSDFGLEPPADFGLEPPADFGPPADLGPIVPDMATRCDTTHGTCQLLALEPSLANSGGASLFFEGTFGSDATVMFPGGVSRPATILGAHRAEVTIPSEATAATLSITTGTSGVGPLPFRRASFALGLGPFAPIYEQANGAQALPALGFQRQYSSSVIVGGALYVIGGQNLQSDRVGSIERARINSDGTLSPFMPVDGVTLATPRWIHSSVVVGSSVYVLGGHNGKPLASVERATTSNGSLSTFTTVPDVTLTTPRSCFGSVVVGNSVYVLGGWHGATTGGNVNVATVERSVVNGDGSLGPFATVDGVTLNIPRSCPAVQVVGSSLYVIGGYSLATGNDIAAVERATIDGDGGLSSFSIVPNVTLATARMGHSTLVLGDALYVVGGEMEAAQTPIASVERATINTDGSLSTFAIVAGVALSTATSGHTAQVVGNSYYVAGGLAPGGAITTRVERASLDAGGNLASFSATGSLATARSFPATAVIGNTLYVVGGRTMTSTTTVERTTIREDGTLGSFAVVPGVTLVTPREESALVVSGRWLYAVGGRAGTHDVTTVERASINDDGSISTFAIVPDVALNVAHAAHTCTIIGNSLYVIGGRDDGSYPGTERASISADGTLGNFALAPNVALVTQRQFHTSFVAGDSLYVVGGWSQGPIGSVERATIAADGSLSSFSTVAGVSLMTPRFGQGSAVVGNTLYVMGGLTFAGGGDLATFERATINADGSLSAFAVVASPTLLTARGGQATLIVGNSLYVIGGQQSAGSLSSIERADLL